MRAGVAELVDAPDSKSGSLWEWGFDSLHPHHLSISQHELDGVHEP